MAHTGQSLPIHFIPKPGQVFIVLFPNVNSWGWFHSEWLLTKPFYTVELLLLTNILQDRNHNPLVNQNALQIFWAATLLGSSNAGIGA